MTVAELREWSGSNPCTGHDGSGTRGWIAEGTFDGERYRGRGWGWFDALEDMFRQVREARARCTGVQVG